jgi:PBSX family phage terminase large subunit
MNNGGRCYFRTATDPDSIVGITNVRAIYCDECGKYPLYFWENIQARSSFKEAPVMLTTSPYALNWVYKDLIRPTLRGERTDVKLIQASSNENPYFSNEEYENKKRTMDKRRFDLMYGGKWDQAAGLVYDCFKHEENVVDSYDLPLGTRYYAGVDWGYTDPFVIVIHAITPQGGRIQVSEFYKTGMTMMDQLEVAISKQKIYNIERWYCDPSRPDSIEAFQRAGLVAVGANNDIRSGIDRVYELIKTRQLKFFRRSNTYTIDEVEMYHYPEEPDLKHDQSGKELMPVGQNDHCLDALRYVTIETSKIKLDGVRLPKRKPLGQTKGIKQVENWS